MDTTIIKGAFSIAGPTLLTNETPPFSEQTRLSDFVRNATPRTEPRLPGMEPNARFRERVFGLDITHHDKCAQMALWGEMFIRRLCGGQQRQIALSGPSGCGKTHVAKKAFRWVSAWGPDLALAHRAASWPAPVWLDWPDAVDTDREQEFDRILEDVRATRVVFIDDIGSEANRFRGGAGAERLRSVLNSCKNKWLLITTNMDLTTMQKTYDARVSDRLLALKWLDLQGVPSYRAKQGGAR